MDGVIKDIKKIVYSCRTCGYESESSITHCPYDRTEMRRPITEKDGKLVPSNGHMEVIISYDYKQPSLHLVFPIDFNCSQLNHLAVGDRVKVIHNGNMRAARGDVIKCYLRDEQDKFCIAKLRR